MIRTLIFIGMGSCLGGIARYLLTRWVQESTSSSFPYGTLAVNLLGCLAIGMLYGLFDRHGWMGPELRAFLVVGFCGGFTTFSTFALENFAMLRDGNWVPAALYAGASLVLGIGAVWLGAVTVRSL